MRENTKWIMLITALAFVALMVFEWGMDMTGQSGGGVGEIGSVNGTPVMYEAYQETYRQIYDQAQDAQEEPLTSQDVRDIEAAAFDQMVNQILIEQELRRRGIQVSNEEILQAARFNPPQEIRRIFQGEQGFDIQQYQQYISSPNADPQILQYLETYFREQIPRAKLLRQVSTGLYPTDQELWHRWRERNESVEVRYLSFDPLNTIPDSEIEISESEMEEYYEENQEEFEVPARATVRAVVLSKTPTPGDTVASAERARELAQELRETGEWEEIAALESGDASTAEQGGDLGVYRPGRMVPAFDTAVFGGPVGEVQDPVATSYGWHVVQVDERWGRDSARARHIMVPIARSDSSEIHLLTMADSLEDLGERVSLTEAASVLGLPVETAQLTSDFPFIAGAGQVGEAADWAFEEASPGDVSPVFETRQAFYAVELVESRPAGVLPFEQVRSSVRQTLAAQKKMARAEARAEALVARIRGGESLTDVAAAEGLETGTAGPFHRSDFVPTLGRRNAAIGASFGLDEGQVAGPVSTSNNVFVIEKLAHVEADSAGWLTQKEAQRAQLINQLQQERLQDWLEGLRASAEIIDRRDEVLRAPEDQEPPRPGGGFGF